jgi:hypothetical protein
MRASQCCSPAPARVPGPPALSSMNECMQCQCGADDVQCRVVTHHHRGAESPIIDRSAFQFNECVRSSSTVPRWARPHATAASRVCLSFYLCFRFPLLATTTPPIIGYSRQELNRAAALHLQARTTAQELSAVPYQFDTMVKTQKGVGWELGFLSFLYFY